MNYLDGCDILGAAPPGRALLIRLRDVPELIRSQAGEYGDVGKQAAQLLPQTIESTVYSKMRDQMLQKLREQGVDAEVLVVEPNEYHSAGSNPIWQPLAIGLGVTTALMTLLYFTKGRR